ncbi:MAG: ECF-type sigma factor [Planctomycetota bacterium]
MVPLEPDALEPALYRELRSAARAALRAERPNHTLCPTELVHEAWSRLMGRIPATTNLKARMAVEFRRVLIDYARSRGAAKRGGGRVRAAIDPEEPLVGGMTLPELVSLHECLHDLAALSPRQAQIVELRYFGGMSNPEIASQLEVSVRTVEASFRMAKAWLFHRLSERA